MLLCTYNEDKGFIEIAAYVTGNDRPTLELLNRIFRIPAAIEWYKLGIELLAVKDFYSLQKIQQEYPGDVMNCCTKMFQLWLKGPSEASWGQLIQALRNIKLTNLADEIEQKQVTCDKGNCIAKIFRH